MADVCRCSRRRVAVFCLLLLIISAILVSAISVHPFIVLILIAYSLIIVGLVLCFVKLCAKTRHTQLGQVLHQFNPLVLQRKEDSSINLWPWRSYDRTALVAATNNFDESNFLGRGGQANVFRGAEVLPDGSAGRHIAVKQFYVASNNVHELHHANLQFKQEVQALSHASHQNVVKLYGCCVNGHERMLVYELMPSGSLHDWLFAQAHVIRDNGRGIGLDWGQRLTIAKDAARGLAYLHSHCNISLVHLDIKPQNILLDEKLRAKIADFGLCKLIGTDQSHLTGGTHVGGTPGYLPPELNGHVAEGWENKITKKADVYSFGIVLLQLVSGRRVSSPPTIIDSGAAPRGDEVVPGQTFRDVAFHLVKTQKTHLLLDAALHNDARESKVGIRMSEIGGMCVEVNPMDRPDMGQVSELLDGISY